MNTPIDFNAEFADVIEANREYALHFSDSALTGVARRGLAVVTCMDSRIAPLALLGMEPGDMKILRNAGARVTEDVLRTLVLANHLLGVNRVLIMPHTNCRMASGEEEQMHEAIFAASGIDTRGIEIRSVTDQLGALKTDVTRVRSFPLLSKTMVVGGAIFDVKTGLLMPQDV